MDQVKKELTFLVLILSIIFLSCNSSDIRPKQGFYRVININDSWFQDYYLITVKSYNDSIYDILSKKFIGNDSCNIKGNKELSMNKTYKLDIELLPHPVIAKSNYFRVYKPHIYIEERLFWAMDTFKVNIYSSDNICGKYFRKK